MTTNTKKKTATKGRKRAPRKADRERRILDVLESIEDQLERLIEAVDGVERAVEYGTLVTRD